MGEQFIMVTSHDTQETLNLHYSDPKTLSEPVVVQLQVLNEIMKRLVVVVCIPTVDAPETFSFLRACL